MESSLLAEDDRNEDDDNFQETSPQEAHSPQHATNDQEIQPAPAVRKRWFSPASLICISHAFSAWGDRMWQFAIAFFLVELTPGSLRLTAIYGTSVSLAIVFFGPLVGDWVDAKPRLKAARMTLVIQNVAVVSCAGVLLVMFILISNAKMFDFVAFILIILSIVAQLASVGTTIAIERDWVVVIAKEDLALLAGTNAILRRIDLTCNILAPVLTGIVLKLGSTIIGVIFLAGWNVLSLFLEYYILTLAYHACPALAIKDLNRSRHGTSNEDQEEFSSLDLDDNADGTILVPRVETSRSFSKTFSSFLLKIKSRIYTLRYGFKLYFQQRVALAGIGLACLYLTVLGFDSITAGYAYSQHLSPAVYGGLVAAGALTGIIGTFIYPQLRKTFGLVKTGIISMSIQLFFLFFCVAAVWAPGHPGHLLDPFRYDHDLYQTTSTVTAAVQKTVTTCNHSFTVLSSINNSTQLNNTTALRPTMILSTYSSCAERRPSELISRSGPSISPTSSVNVNISGGHNHTNISLQASRRSGSSFISLLLLMGGIVMSRIGLWMSDLVITQLFQENVAEKERGIVGGVQNSFNNIMDVGHFVIVTVAPRPNQFGALILVSVCMVSLGFAAYARFAWKFSRRIVQLERLSQWSRSNESIEGSLNRLRLGEQGDSQEDITAGTLTVENENYSR